jgi:hypothetical protein
MPYSLKQAAEATGKTKPTILRAIQTGKISAVRHAVTGAWLIEPAELHRVYPVFVASVAQQDNSKPEQLDVMVSEITVLRRELQMRDEKLQKEQQERERERIQLQGAIDDLRRRLDTEGEERRKLTAILTDQRPKVPEVIAMPPPSSPGTTAQALALQDPPPHASPTQAVATPSLVASRPVTRAVKPQPVAKVEAVKKAPAKEAANDQPAKRKGWLSGLFG